jgi:anti-sigma factor RsiW
MTHFMTCQSKDLLVTYLYEETSAEERRAVEAHLTECADCRAEVEALTSLRGTLAGWEAPTLHAHFRVVAERGAAPPPSRRWWIAAPVAAAAVLVLAAAAAVSNLEIRYDAEGLAVRTGWSQGTTPPSAAGVRTVETAGAVGNATPWRADLRALEQQLRAELTQARGPAVAPVPAAVSSRTSDADLLRRVQAMIDESEVRQQRNLALRMTEVSRDFAMQRQADLVQIQQGMGRLEGRTEAEAARARELMNYIMRVSQPQQAPPR